MLPTIACPACSATLRRPANLSAGKQIRCPQCQLTFSPPPDDGTAALTTAPSPAAVRPLPAAARPEPAKQDTSSPDHPRRRGPSTAAVVIGILVVLFVVLVGGGLVLAGIVGFGFFSVSKSGSAVASAPPVANSGPPPVRPMQPIPPGAGGAAPPGPQRTPQPAPRVGEKAPEIEGKDLDGKPMKLSDFRGKVVVLDFWGDWCPFCKAAYSYQRNLVRRMEGRSFVLLGVNCDDTREQARLVVKNHRISWRSWWDGPADMSGSLYRRWGVHAVPSVFLINPQGILAGQYEGAPPEDDLERSIESMLPASEKGRPRWLAPEEMLQQLGVEEKVGPYRMRLPAGFTAQHPQSDGKQQTFRWKNSALLRDSSEQIEVVVRPGVKDSPESAIEKELKGLPCLRQGWTCSIARRGEINGLTFYRVNWVGIHQDSKRPIQGFIYVGTDGDTLIQAAGQASTDARSLLLAEAAVLTISKPSGK